MGVSYRKHRRLLIVFEVANCDLKNEARAKQLKYMALEGEVK